MRSFFRISPFRALFQVLACLFLLFSSGGAAMAEDAHRIELPPARTDGPQSLESTLNQSAVAGAPVVFVISAVYERTLARYGERGIRYVHMEAGHAAQNVCLQAVALGLHSVVIGAFRDRHIQQVLGLNENEHPLYLIPVGR
jgi:SagB-type dehydrogenase family enzyme